MPRKRIITKEEQFDSIMREYKERYDVDSLVNPNDVASLRNMIRNQLIIESLQERIETLAETDNFDSAELKKMLDGIRDLSDTNVKLERALGIDRKTRKTDQADSFPEHLAAIKKIGREFLENRIIRVQCKACKIMVGRISGVYDTTEFTGAFQCPQCQKFTTVSRKERDIFFDVKNADWRRKHPMEIIPAKRNKDAPDIDVAADVVLDIEDDVEYGVQ